MLLGASSDLYIEALLASLDCGGIAVPINFRWSASDVAHAVQIAEPSIILFDDAFSDLVTCALEIICKSIHNRHQASPQTQLYSAVQSPGNQSLQLMPKLVALGRHQGQSGALLSTSQLIQKTQEAHPSATDSASQLQLLGEPTVTAVTGMDPPRSLTGAISGRTLNMASSHTVNDFAKAPHGLQMLSPADGSALICFTSGTTGRPKGVVLTHYNFHVQSLAKLAAVQYCKEDVYLNTSPLFHVGGLSSLFANLMAGASQIVLPKFDAQSVLSVIKSRSVTSFIAVPTMIQDLIHHSETMARDERGRGRPSQELPQGSSALLSVQRILVGAGKISAEVMEKVKSLFPNAALYTAYGMTEACSSITFNVLHTPSQVRAQSQSHAIKVTSEDMDAQASRAAPSISKDTTRGQTA
ncbi:hypothetical protein CEUSTIGMA_g9598.t1 [Chlamydomonas eustigma]|uniref:AMP-dependent synthetase/ligase domain-containing protein n=1 Tax=Chlamydomonas eustigma TaxID=1157962 RepID=A0A250XH98_9CHLO|nr:hypothetical protein CEUSTIGMA_g9598.t1 [Chlamydomonas eustigma]|eukprot:GAX82170.1 hypothetical protein CEUSTIGMA_g9598.t1 [Chlamydomonas eustigma]